MKSTQEPKYDVNAAGRLFNRDTGREIPDDEPVIIFRARDVHAIHAIKSYLEQCEVEGHWEAVSARLDDFKHFAKENPDRMREPGALRELESLTGYKKADERLSDKTLGNTDINGTKKNVPDVVVFGNGDLVSLLCKASSKGQGWMKSTKAMQVPGGCVVQVTTQQMNPDGSYAVAEALTYVPGVVIADDINNGRKLVAINA